VLDALGSKGQEVSRIVQDCGVNIAWHFATKGLNHPLFQMIRRKIWASEERHGLKLTPDPIQYYFPRSIEGVSLEDFILDQSFYKPRDIVWRLAVAREQFPNSTFFDAVVLAKTDIHYSGKMWEEIMYELNAMYTNDEVAVIEKLFFAQHAFFDLADVADRLQQQSVMSPVADKLFRRRGVRAILQDMYRLGAIGNVYRVANQPRHRWVHRGEAGLVENFRMQLHPALTRRLSAYYERRIA
jgi:hypothetical protein